MKSESRRILRFLAVGVLNTGFGYVSYVGFVLGGAPLWIVVSGSTLLAFSFNFLSYGGLVYGATSVWLLPRFLLFYIVLGGLNFVLLRLLTAWSLGPLVAQALLLPILAVSGYFGLRNLVFCGQRPVGATMMGK